MAHRVELPDGRTLLLGIMTNVLADQLEYTVIDKDAELERGRHDALGDMRGTIVDLFVDTSISTHVGVELKSDSGTNSTYCDHVYSGSPAEEAGLRKGDVLLKVGFPAREPGTNTMFALGLLQQKNRMAGSTHIQVNRPDKFHAARGRDDWKQQTRLVELTLRATSSNAQTVEINTSAGELCVTLGTKTISSAHQVHIKGFVPEAQGVVYDAGLRDGDILEKVNGVAVSSHTQALALLKKAKKKRAVVKIEYLTFSAGERRNEILKSSVGVECYRDQERGMWHQLSEPTLGTLAKNAGVQKGDMVHAYMDRRGKWHRVGEMTPDKWTPIPVDSMYSIVVIRRSLQPRLASEEDASSGFSLGALKEAILENFANVKDVLISMDEDKDGKISKREFRRAVMSLDIEASRQQIDALFDRLDRDGGGSLDFKELHTALEGRRASTMVPDAPATALLLPAAPPLPGPALVPFEVMLPTPHASEDTVATAPSMSAALAAPPVQVVQATEVSAIHTMEVGVLSWPCPPPFRARA